MLGLFLVLLAACTRGPALRVAQPPKAVAAEEQRIEAVPRYRIELVLRPQESRAEIKVIVQGAAEQLERWHWPSAVKPAAVVAIRPAEGKRLRWQRQKGQTYTLEGLGSSRQSASKAQGIRLEFRYQLELRKNAVEQIDGREFIVYPIAWENEVVPVELELSMASDGAAVKLASSTGELRHFEASARGLSRYRAIWGPLIRAKFQDSAGRQDSFASRGHFLFDVRWVAAELAGLRSAVDNYFASPHASSFQVFLLEKEKIEPGRAMELEGTLFGVQLTLPEQSQWDSPQRLAYLAYLVRKKLTTLVDFPETQKGRWAQNAFEHGCSRYLARHLAYNNGSFLAQEYAEELNRFEALRLSPQGPRNALRSRAYVAGSELCAQLDRLFRSSAKGSESLRDWLYELRVLRQSKGRALSLQEVEAKLESLATPEIVQTWKATIHEQRAPNLAEGIYAPCLTRAKSRYRFYDFGFSEPRPGEALGELTPFGVQVLKLRPDDRFVAWSLDDEEAPKRVELEIEREGVRQRRSYAPLVSEPRGVRWRRLPKVAEMAEMGCGL